MTAKNTQNGFSLVEVLVSVLILSVGLLGMAALQVSSIRSNHTALMYSQATIQASAMADRMRANLAGVSAGYYDAFAPSSGPLSQSQVSAMGCSACSTQQTALRDYTVWSQMNAAVLPSGQGSVMKVGNIHRITVMWDNNKTGAQGTACSGNPNVDLTCINMDVDL